MTDTEDIKAIIKAGLRSIAASVPVAASIAQAWNEYETHVQFTRVEAFFDTMKSEMQAMSRRIEVAKQFILESGEIPSLIERTIDKIRKENSESKRQKFAHLLTNSIVADQVVTYDDKLTFIEDLDLLTDSDILVLSIFRQGVRYEVKQLIVYSSLSHIPREERLAKLAASLSKLESRGLIAETIGHKDLSVMARIFNSEGWEEKYKKKYFELLPHGIIFCEMVLGDSI